MRFKLKQTMWVGGGNHEAGEVVDLSDNEMIERLLDKGMIEEAGKEESKPETPVTTVTPEVPAVSPAAQEATATPVPLGESSQAEPKAPVEPLPAPLPQPVEPSAPEPVAVKKQPTPSEINKTIETVEGISKKESPDLGVTIS